MTEYSNFREINEIESKIISKSLFNIFPKLFEFLKRSEQKLYISLRNLNLKTNYPTLYLISNIFRKDIDLIETKGNIYSAGLYFGFIKKGNFYLSLEGAEFLYRRGIIPGIKHICVNKKGEKSILYGNNILKSTVIKMPLNLQEKDLLLVINEMNEILAIAQSKVKSKIITQLKSEDIIALNLNDKGIYLREKQ
ncbi:MAG: hypothetical protein ACFFDN_26720 [Candidatus Hodarchaeota archaeon]